jgi:hypothetical protein
MAIVDLELQGRLPGPARASVREVGGRRVAWVEF